MHKSQITFTYEGLAKMFDLPPDAFITGVADDTFQHGTVRFRIMSERPAPEELSIEDTSNVSMVGEAYRNPENYPLKKGCCLSDFEGFPGNSSCSEKK